MADDLPEDFYAPTRDKVVQDAQDSFLVRHMSVDPTKALDVGPGSFPAIASEVLADLAMPHYANEVSTGRSWLVRNTFGERLERLALEKLGAEDGVRRPAIGAQGYIEATKIVEGGASIDENTVLIHQPTSQRFRVLEANTYFDEDPIPIVGISTGAATNLDANAELVFESQPSGCSLTARVLEQNDGTGNLVGLTGGRAAETDEELQSRILDAQANPPAAGNSAQVVQVAQKTAAVPVEKAFTVEAWMGPGSCCVLATMRPDAVSSRIPNSVQRGLIEADLRGSFPADYSLTVGTLIAQPFTVAVGVTWISSARKWTDLVQWPPYVEADPVHVAETFSSSSMRLATDGSATVPTVGKTIGFFDGAARTFRRKRIATVNTVLLNKIWDVTFDTALGASETFEAVEGALVSPWSSSLSRLVAPMIAYARSLGPGEQFASLPDPGGRRRRWPFSPDEWPSVVTNEGLVTATKASGAISDVEPLLPATPHATTVGVPGVAAYLLQLTDFAVFPQT